MNTKKRRMKAVFLLFMLVTFFLTSQRVVLDFTFASDNTTVKIDVGVKGMHISLTGEALAKSYESITGDDGTASFDDLYEYCAKELGWEIDETKGAASKKEPEKKEIVIYYDINYADTSIWNKDSMPNGNGRYEGIKGSFTLTMEKEEGENKFRWKETIKIEGLAEVEFIKGDVFMYPYGENIDKAAPAKDIEITTTGDSKNLVNTLSGEDGSFEFYPGATTSIDKNTMIIVEETPYHYGYEKSYQEFIDEGKVILLEEKYIAVSGEDYSYETPIKFGYVKEAGTYRIYVAAENEISLSPDGSFTESIEISINDIGNVPDLYIKNKEGKISQPVKNVLKIDSKGPVITSVDSVSETEGSSITFNDFGIFTNETADFTLEVTAKDEGCGIEKLVMVGRDKDGTYHYSATKTILNEDKISSTFEVASQKELLKQELSILAIDYLGNESEYKLIRGEGGSSDLTIEKNTPKLTDISIDGNPSAYGWYSDDVSFEFSALDEESGLKYIAAKINGKTILNETFHFYEKEEKAYTLKLTKALIAELEEPDGKYKVEVMACDNCNNVTTKSVVIKADILPPAVFLSGISQGAIFSGVPAITLSTSEKYYYEKGAAIYVNIYRYNQLIASPVYSSRSSAQLDGYFNMDGEYKVTAYAIDAAGNKSSMAQLSFTIDKTAPQINLQGVEDANISVYGWYNQPFTYRFTVSDETTSVSNLSATVNGVPVDIRDMSTIEFSKEIIEKCMNEEGSYMLFIMATDQAGNTATYTEVFWIDLVAPDLTLSGIEEGKHYRKTPELTIENNEKHFAAVGAHMNVKIERDNKVISDEKIDLQNRYYLSNFEKDGTYTITVNAADAAGNQAETKKISFVKDTTSPIITIEGAEKDQYYNTAKKISISVDELYFENNQVEVEIIRNLDGKTYHENFNWKNKNVRTVNSQTLGKTGTYTIRVSAVDEAGNQAKTKNLTFTVDTEPPQVEIFGVTDRIYTYDDIVAPRIRYSDSYLANKKVSVTRAGTKWLGNLAKSDNGNTISFFDFKKVRLNDGIYHLQVTAFDKAGNSTTKEVNFVVNRFGSSYRYNRAIRQINGKYVKEVPEELVISEYNVSELEKSRNEIKLDGEVIHKNMVTSFSGFTNGLNQYDHVFEKSSFFEEGVYQINVFSQDKAGNKMESKENAGPIKFYVDRTAPIISTAGMDDGVVKTKTLKITVAATDNLSKADIEIKVQDKEIKGKEDKDGTITFDLREGLSQKVEIIAKDAAGNESSFVKNISVTPNAFLFFLLNYKYYLFALIGVTVLGIILVIRKKKKNKS